MSVTRSFVYPDSARFDCLRCGDCCRGWRVMLGPGEPERLLSLRWDGDDARLRGEHTVEREDERRFLARREDGACVYLGDDNECRIHARFGEAEKPLLCRMFPFGFLPVGDVIAVDVSYSCRATSSEHGGSLEARLPEWRRLVDEGASGDRKSVV